MDDPVMGNLLSDSDEEPLQEMNFVMPPPLNAVGNPNNRPRVQRIGSSPPRPPPVDIPHEPDPGLEALLLQGIERPLTYVPQEGQGGRAVSTLEPAPCASMLRYGSPLPLGPAPTFPMPKFPLPRPKDHVAPTGAKSKRIYERAILEREWDRNMRRKVRSYMRKTLHRTAWFDEAKTMVRNYLDREEGPVELISVNKMVKDMKDVMHKRVPDELKDRFREEIMEFVDNHYGKPKL